MIKIPCPFAGSILIFLIVFIIVSFFRFLEIIRILVFLISRIISLWLIICKSPTRNFCSCDSKWSKWPNYIPTRFKLFYGNSRLKLFFSFWVFFFSIKFWASWDSESPTPASTLWEKIFLSDSHSKTKRGR